MNKIKKLLSAILFSCLFLSSMQFTAYAASYLLGGGYHTSKVSVVNNISKTTISPYLLPAVNSWNSATSKVKASISVLPTTENYVVSAPTTDTWFGATGIGASYFVIQLNENKCTTANAKSVIVHEFGHVFNLLDNNLPLSSSTIMSNYRDRTTLTDPTSIDIAGVNASYDSSYNLY